MTGAVKMARGWWDFFAPALVVLALFSVSLMLSAALGASHYLWRASEQGKPAQMTLLSLEPQEKLMLMRALDFWNYLGLQDALVAAKEGHPDTPSEIFLGGLEARQLAKDVQRLARDSDANRADLKEREEQAALQMARLALEGVSWDQAVAELRKNKAAASTQERWAALEAKLGAAPRMELGIVEVFITPWFGDRGPRDLAIARDAGTLFWVVGLTLFVFLLALIAMAVSVAGFFKEKMQGLIERHREKLESDVEAGQLARDSRAPKSARGPA